MYACVCCVRVLSISPAPKPECVCSVSPCEIKKLSVLVITSLLLLLLYPPMCDIHSRSLLASLTHTHTSQLVCVYTFALTPPRFNFPLVPFLLQFLLFHSFMILPNLSPISQQCYSASHHFAIHRSIPFSTQPITNLSPPLHEAFRRPILFSCISVPLV